MLGLLIFATLVEIIFHPRIDSYKDKSNKLNMFLYYGNYDKGNRKSVRLI